MNFVHKRIAGLLALSMIILGVGWITAPSLKKSVPTAQAAGTTYYVATNGNDSNNGSAGSPFLTLQKAVSVLQAGDTLNVRAGSYAGFIVGWDAAGQGVYGAISGTANAPITIQADPVAVPGSVIINNKNSKTQVGIDLEPGCDYVTIKGFKIDGAGTIAVYPNKGYGIKTNSSNDKILNNIVTNIDYGTAGIHSNGGNNTLIEGNTVTKIGWHNNGNFGHGIYIADGDGIVVRNNSIHDNDYIGLHINGDPNVVSHALIENNQIYNNGQNGINADGLQSSTVRNNLIYGYANYGIVLFTIDASGPSTNNTFTNNTIVSTVNGASEALRLLDSASGNVVKNNFLLSSAGSYRIEDTASTPTTDYNIVSTPLGGGQDAHSFVSTAAANFVNPASDFHLKSGAPAIDKGTTVASVTTDLDGNPRPQGSAYDIGTYEFGGATPPPTTPTPTPVPAAMLTLAKSVDKATAIPGDKLTYTLAYSNTGSASAGNVVLTDIVPAGTTYVANSASGGGKLANGTLTWNLAPIAASTSGSITFQATVN